MRQERQKYQDQIEAQFRDLDQRIDDLAARIEKENSEARTKARGREYRDKSQQEIAELQRKREIARRKLENLRNSSQDAWQDMKVGIDAAMRDLKSAYDQAASHFQ